MVCGVPDSGIIAHQGYAKASGIPYGTGFVKNKYIGRTVGTGKDKKKRLLKTRLTALKANVSGKRIIIVDDSIVRGETANHIVKLLRDAGAKEVHMLISSPPLYVRAISVWIFTTRSRLLQIGFHKKRYAIKSVRIRSAISAFRVLIKLPRVQMSDFATVALQESILRKFRELYLLINSQRK